MLTLNELVSPGLTGKARRIIEAPGTLAQKLAVLLKSLQESLELVSAVLIEVEAIPLSAYCQQVPEFVRGYWGEPQEPDLTILAGLIETQLYGEGAEYAETGSRWCALKQVKAAADCTSKTESVILAGSAALALFALGSGDSVEALLLLSSTAAVETVQEGRLWLEDYCARLWGLLARVGLEQELVWQRRYSAMRDRVAELFRSAGADSSSFFSGVAELLPGYMNYPEYGFCRLQYLETEYASSNYPGVRDRAGCGYSTSFELRLYNAREVCGYIQIGYAVGVETDEDVLLVPPELELLEGAAELLQTFITVLFDEPRFHGENNELQAIFEGMSVLLIVVDKQMQIVNSNKVALQLIGVPLAEIRGLSVGEALRCVNLSAAPLGCGTGRLCKSCRLRRLAEQTLRSGEAVIRHEVFLKLGSDVEPKALCLLASTHPLIIRGQQNVLISLEDVTDMRRQEKQVRDSEELLRTLVTTLPDVVTRVDREFRYMYISPIIMRFFVIDIIDVKGKRASELNLPSDFCELSEIKFKEVLYNQEPMELEFEVQTLRGRTVFNWRANPEFNDQGRLASIVSIYRDITETRLAESAVKLSQEKLAAVFHATPDALLMIRFEDRVIIEANKTFEIMFKIPLREVIGSTTKELNIWNDNAERDNIYCMLEETKMVVEENVLLKRRGGELFNAVVYAESIHFTEEDYIFVSMRDISDIIQLHEQLRQSEKMSAIGQLAGGIAHDFNNQLTGILGFADIILSKYDQPGLKEYVDKIITSACHSANLTQQLLTFSRKGRYLSEMIDMHACLLQVIKVLCRMVGKGIEVGYDFNAVRAVVKGDEGQIQSALLNLVMNAREALNNSGEIWIQTSNITVAQGYHDRICGYINAGMYLQIKITDTGSGISEGIQDRIFEPFFTTKKQGDGIGMGLPMAYGTIIRCNGAIKMDSVAGIGSTFTVLLPLASSDESGLEQTETEAQSCSDKKRILLVDDEDMALMICSEMLWQLGHEVISCGNGKEALKIFETEHAGIDLVILDMVMPGMNGRDVYHAMRQIAQEVKVIIASGYSSNKDVLRVLEEGALGMLQKPFRYSELSGLVNKYV